MMRGHDRQLLKRLGAFVRHVRDRLHDDAEPSHRATTFLAWIAGSAAPASYDDAMRTIVDLPEDQVRALADITRREGISRAEAIRRAIAAYARGRARGAGDTKAFGSWKERAEDGLRYEDRLREEW